MQPSFGTGSTLLGGDAGSALQEAMARRQTGQAGTTAQQTPASPGFQPMPQSPTGQAPIAQPSTPAQPSQPQGTGLPFESTEAKQIIGALSNRMKSLSKMGEMMLGGGLPNGRTS